MASRLVTNTLRLLVFLYLFSPFLKVSGAIIHMPYIIYAVSSVFLVFCCKQWIVVSRRASIVAIFLIGYFFYVLLLSLVTSNVDLSFFVDVVVGFLCVGSAACIVYLYGVIYGSKAYGYLLLDILFSCAFHAFIMIAIFVFPLFSTTLYSFVHVGDKAQDFVALGHRVTGLSSTGGDGLSLIQSFGFALAYIYYCFYVRLGLYVRAFLCFASLPLLLFSIMLSGRTGLVAAFVLLLVILVLNLDIQNSKAVSLGKVKKNFLILLPILCVGLSMVAIFLIGAQLENTRFVLRAFEFYFSYIENSNLDTSSSSALLEMIIFPDNLLHLIFGSGNFGRDDLLPYLSSDIGFVRVVYGSGLVGLTILLCALVLFSLFAYRAKNLHHHRIAFVAFLILFALANLKSFNFFGISFVTRIMYLQYFALAFHNSFSRLRSRPPRLQETLLP